MKLGDLDALKEDFDCVGFNDYDDYNRALRIIDNAQTVSIKSCRECPFVAGEEKQITNGDAWKSYCEGQEVGFKKAEYVFERMKLIQETVDCIRNTFNLDIESHKIVRNCMSLVQNAIDGEYHDMEDVDVSELESSQGEWVPVSERLPEKTGYYLVTRKGFSIKNHVKRVGYDANTKRWSEGSIIAWQLLPEPYERRC